MATRNYEGKKIDGTQIHDIVDALTIEEALQININDTPFTVSMRTPGNDVSLMRGLLHAEDIINDVLYHPKHTSNKKNEAGIITEMNLNISESKLGKGYSNSRSLLSVSSCGICGKTELNDFSSIEHSINDMQKIDVSLMHQMFNKMNDCQFDFRQSGGTHAAAAFSIDGKLLCAMEDIGRHNAVDKVIGQLILTEKLEQAKVMTVSGRISYEIIIKCFKANIPFLAAVSAPSSLAVDYAKELGITLFGFCRDDRTTCYSHPERIRILDNLDY